MAYGYLQRGNNAAARRVLEELQALEPPYQNHAATAYTFAAVPARYALERHAWDEASQVTVGWPEDIPWVQYPHLEAIPTFARALGAARTKFCRDQGRRAKCGRVTSKRQRES